jgi:ATP-dependent Zn protease
MQRRTQIQIANWTREGIEEIKEALAEFVDNLKDPLFYIALAIFLGILAGSIFGK